MTVEDKERKGRRELTMVCLCVRGVEDKWRKGWRELVIVNSGVWELKTKAGRAGES